MSNYKMRVLPRYPAMTSDALRTYGLTNYDALGKRIINLGDAVDNDDAVNLEQARLVAAAAVAGVGSVNAATDVAKRFYNIRTYGAVCDGTTDDSTAIEGAINAAINAAGGVVIIPADTKITRAMPDITANNVRIWSPSGAKVNVVSSSDINAFKFLGPGLGSDITLLYDTTAGGFAIPASSTGISIGDFLYFSFTDTHAYTNTFIGRVRAAGGGSGAVSLTNALTVTSASATVSVHYPSHGLSVGWPIVVKNAVMTGGDYRANGLFTVASVTDTNNFTYAIPLGTWGFNQTNGGGTFTLFFYPLIIDSGVPFDLLTAATTKQIAKWTPIYNVGIDNIEIDASGSSGDVTGVYAQHVAHGLFRVRAKGCRAHVFNSGTAAGLYATQGYNNHFEAYTENCGSGGWNDISIYGQTGPTGFLRSSRAYGFGPGLYYSSKAKLQSIICEGAAERGVKLNASVDCDIDTIDVDAAGFIGFGFSGGARKNRIKVVRARNCVNFNVWSADQYCCNNWIGKVESTGCLDSADVAIYPNDTGNIIDYVNPDALIYNGGAAEIGNRWTSYTPLLTPFSGSFGIAPTINAARWKANQDGTITVWVDITMPANVSTAAGPLQVAFPTAFPGVVRGGHFTGMEGTGGTIPLTGYANQTTSFTIQKYDGSTAIVNDYRLVGEVTYQRQAT